MIDISSIEIFRVFIKYYRVFSKMTQNKKSNAKLAYDFFGTFICLIHLISLDYSKKYHYLF